MSLGAAKGSARDQSRVDAGYELYGMDLSFFTQKVRAALDFYFPSQFKMVNKTPANQELIETRAQTHQIPVLITPENWVIADSTPILHLLDSRLPIARLYPNDGLSRSVVALVEEFFDEWMARLTVHTRWYYAESAEFAAAEMMRLQGVASDQIPEMLSSPLSPTHWGKRVCRALGMSSETQITAGEKELWRIHKALDSHLSKHKFILGDAPCAIDCVLLGGLRAHFLTDPWPKSFLAGLPNLHRYCTEAGPVSYAAVANPIDTENLPPFVEFVLSEMGGGFRNFVLSNSEAITNGSKAFQADVYGEQVSYLARPYVEKSRQMLRLYTGAVLNSENERNLYTSLLQRFGLADLYSPRVMEHSRL